MSTACLSGLILGSSMCTLIVLCRKFNRDPGTFTARACFMSPSFTTHTGMDTPVWSYDFKQWDGHRTEHERGLVGRLCGSRRRHQWYLFSLFFSFIKLNPNPTTGLPAVILGALHIPPCSCRCVLPSFCVSDGEETSRAQFGVDDAHAVVHHATCGDHIPWHT